MCEPSQLAAYMLSDFFRKASSGRQVFVVMNANAMEAIVSSDQDESPEGLLARYCEAFGGDIKERRCLPIVLPEGFTAGLRREFRVVANGDSLRIEPK
jgi:hypothetical protein